MKLHPIFKLREKATAGIVDLLESVTLGTNGAHYAHLDTRTRIEELDSPLHLSMERNENVLGNITFCRRGKDWYIRYFAVSPKLQSAGQKKSKAKKTNLLKSELSKFFSMTLDEGHEGEEVDSFYAYIDPNNEKSLWIGEMFGLETIGHIDTQTFSRVSPKQSPRVEKIEDWSLVKSLVEEHFGDYQYFISLHTSKPPFYIIRDENGEIIAFTKTTIANWEIKRLPGKFGSVLTKLIPLIPGVRKIIRPKKHTFIVPEAVIVKDNNPELLSELFEGILHKNSLNLIIWWIDENEKLYQTTKGNIKWGILNSMVGVTKANVVVNAKSELKNQSVNPFYTSGVDFI